MIASLSTESFFEFKSKNDIDSFRSVFFENRLTHIFSLNQRIENRLAGSDRAASALQNLIAQQVWEFSRKKLSGSTFYPIIACSFLNRTENGGNRHTGRCACSRRARIYVRSRSRCRGGRENRFALIMTGQKWHE